MGRGEAGIGDQAGPDGREPIVWLDGVVRRFGQLVAVNDVRLAIEEGEFFSLLGPSGSGKTTLLRLIAGFEQPDTGEITIAGKPMRKVPPERRPVNTVFQSYALFPTKSVFENVAYGLRVRRLRGEEVRRRVDAALGLVRLEGLGTRSVTRLSGGQAQRVALARALVLEPRVLLLDEPLGALDLKLRREMQVELKRIQHQVGITFIYVTHDQEEALTMSDRIAVVNEGRLEQVDTPAEIYRRPATPFVASFLGETNLLDHATLNGATEGSSIAGSDGLWSLRPDAVSLGQAARTCPVALSARVVDSSFLGSQVRYRLDVRPGLTLTAVTSSREPLLRPQEITEIGWDPATAAPVGAGT